MNTNKALKKAWIFVIAWVIIVLLVSMCGCASTKKISKEKIDIVTEEITSSVDSSQLKSTNTTVTEDSTEEFVETTVYEFDNTIAPDSLGNHPYKSITHTVKYKKNHIVQHNNKEVVQKQNHSSNTYNKDIYRKEQTIEIKKKSSINQIKKTMDTFLIFCFVAILVALYYKYRKIINPVIKGVAVKCQFQIRRFFNALRKLM